MDEIETRTAFITLHEPAIVWLNYKTGVEIDKNDIQENIQASLILTKGKIHGAILDTRGKDVSITNAAMKYGASTTVLQHRVATAYLSTSLSGKLFGDFFMKFYKPKINNRLFTDKIEAVKWLRPIVQG
jgi:hypothetical protein